MFRGELQRLAPRASQQLPHPAMSAAAGGPLAVRQDETLGKLVLTEPRFQGSVLVDPRQSSQLHCGQVVQVMFRPRDQTLVEYVNERLRKWIRTKVDAAEQD